MPKNKRNLFLQTLKSAQSKIKKILKFFIKGNTDNQRELRRGVKLPRFN